MDALYYEINVFITLINNSVPISTTQRPPQYFYVEIYDALFHGGDHYDH